METKLENGKDVAEPDQFASGTAGTGQENNELKWMRKHEAPAKKQVERLTGLQYDQPDDQSSQRSTPKLVERRTGLRGQHIDPARKSKQGLRSRTKLELLAYDSEIPYAAVDQANQDLICSLIERQDRVTEQLLLMINNLEYRVDDIEQVTQLRRSPRTRTTKEGPE